MRLAQSYGQRRFPAVRKCPAKTPRASAGNYLETYVVYRPLSCSRFFVSLLRRRRRPGLAVPRESIELSLLHDAEADRDAYVRAVFVHVAVGVVPVILALRRR